MLWYNTAVRAGTKRKQIDLLTVVEKVIAN